MPSEQWISVNRPPASPVFPASKPGQVMAFVQKEVLQLSVAWTSKERLHCAGNKHQDSGEFLCPSCCFSWRS